MINTEDYADDFIAAKRNGIDPLETDAEGNVLDPYTISLPSDTTDPESDPVLVDTVEPYSIDYIDEDEEVQSLNYPGIKADMQLHAESLFKHLTSEIITANADANLTAIAQVVIVDATGGTVDLTLPAAADSTGKRITVVKNGTNTVRLLGTIDGITNYEVIDRCTVVSDGTGYYTLEPREQRGSDSVTTATSKAVTFPQGMPNSSYMVDVELDSDTYYWVTSKTTSGFTVNFPASVTLGFEWRAKQ